MLDQRKFAILERNLRIIQDSYKVKWIHLEKYDINFNVAIQLLTEQDIHGITELELSKTFDNIYTNTVYSDSELIEICDQLYKHIANRYTRHDVHIDIVKFNQPVLSTTYVNK